jgi:hypothetical protein
MANIGVRSPFYIRETQSGGVSATMTLTVNGNVVYTVTKNTGTLFLVDISNLVRDYVQPTYDGTIDTDATGSATVATSVQFYDANLLTVGIPKTSSHVAYDGYGYFSDGTSQLPSGGTTDIWLSADTIWAPEGEGGAFYNSNQAGALFINTYTSSDTTKSGIAIKRHECSKYTPIKVVFINRFGVPQELWFFGKTIESSNSAREFYKSNLSTALGNWQTSIYKHQNKSFEVNGKTQYTLNTGLVGEEYNEFVRELMLSEQVWMHIDNTIRPVTATSSELTFRTSLNDKMVQYTVEFEQANDLIATVR